MVEVKVARVKTKKNQKILYTVAILANHAGKKFLSYQGRYKNKAAALKKRDEILNLMNERAKK